VGRLFRRCSRRRAGIIGLTLSIQKPESDRNQRAPRRSLRFRQHLRPLIGGYTGRRTTKHDENRVVRLVHTNFKRRAFYQGALQRRHIPTGRRARERPPRGERLRGRACRRRVVCSTAHGLRFAPAKVLGASGTRRRHRPGRSTWSSGAASWKDRW
jgi:hypothetical protein